MASFTLDLQKYADKTKQSMGDAVREVVMKCAGLVDERSPVGNTKLWLSLHPFVSLVTPTGRYKKNPASGKVQYEIAPPEGYLGGHFRINNQYGFGSAPTGEIDGTDEDGKATMLRIKAQVEGAPVAGLHYIANNVPYAMALENGHSTQAPQGIYGLAAIDAAGAANAVIRKRFG